MKTSTTSTVLSCTPEVLWATFFDESYLSALYLEELEYRAFSVIEMGETLRRLRIVPKISLPGPIASLVDESFAYEEHATLDRARSEWTWQIVQPENLDSTSTPRKEVVTMHGEVRIEVTGDGHCRRTDDFCIEATLFGLGGLIESSIEGELRSARAKEYAFLSKWVEKRGT